MTGTRELPAVDPAELRRRIEARGVALASELELDQAAFQLSANVHWTFVLMKTALERGPLADLDLSMSAFVALWALRASGELEACEVAAEVGITRSGFSGLARRLEGRGLISRRPHPGDGRSVLLALTPSGRQLIDAAWPAVNATAEVLASALGEDEQLRTADALRRLADGAVRLLDKQ